MNYIIEHWSQISAGVLSIAVFCAGHGVIKGIGLTLWRGNPKQ